MSLFSFLGAEKAPTRSQTDIMLDLLKSRTEVHTDVFREHGIRDHRTCKYRLARRGYIIHTIQRKRKNDPKKSDEGIYVLVGYGCPTERRHRDYLDKFKTEEIEEELRKRGLYVVSTSVRSEDVEKVSV